MSLNSPYMAFPALFHTILTEATFCEYRRVLHRWRNNCRKCFESCQHCIDNRVMAVCKLSGYTCYITYYGRIYEIGYLQPTKCIHDNSILPVNRRFLHYNYDTKVPRWMPSTVLALLRNVVENNQVHRKPFEYN